MIIKVATGPERLTALSAVIRSIITVQSEMDSHVSFLREEFTALRVRAFIFLYTLVNTKNMLPYVFFSSKDFLANMAS